LTLANLAAALFSIRQQNFARVAELVVVDNNTDDPEADIQRLIDACAFPVPVRLLSHKHGDATRTHAWSTNVAVRAAQTPMVLFTRADYLLAVDAVDRFVAATEGPAPRFAWESGQPVFVVGGYYDLVVDVEACEQFDWRRLGTAVLHPFGREYSHTVIDSGVWYTSRQAFEQVGGLDERLVAYGHAQTHFQYKLHRAGIACVRLPEILFYHPRHDYEVPRDLTVAQQELQAIGVSLVDLWARYDGPDHPRYDDQGVFHG
jgi:hypothetical protein